MATRDYQTKASDNVIEAFDEGEESTLVVMPTGTGKTHMFCGIAERMFAKTGKRTLILAHRDELIRQARDKVAELTSMSVDIEMAEKYSYTGELYAKTNVVVSSIQTQNAGRLGGRKMRFKKEDFGLVVVDEAHHAPAKSYRKVLDYYKHEHIKLLGVTATPDRKDEAALGQIFGSVSYVYEINDAIDDGWLVPISQHSAYVDSLSFDSVKKTAGDFNLGDLDRVMGFEKVLHGIINPTLECVGDRQAVLFAVSLGHAERMCEILNRHKFGCARFVYGKTPKDERRRMFRDFLDGEFQFLTNVGVCTEGVDLPKVGAVVMARPTQSRALYCQMLGRGTRPLPGIVDPYPSPDQRRSVISTSAKPDLMVLDFVAQAGRHKLMTAANVLGGKYDDEVIDRANQNMEDRARSGEKPDPDSIEQRLKKAEFEIASEREQERRRHIKASEVKYRLVSHNPFAVLDITPVREYGWDAAKPATDKQLAALSRFGLSGEDVREMTKNKATQLIGRLITRSKKGLCSFKQARLLTKNGFDNAETMTRAEASKHISVLARGWKRKRRTG